VVDTFRQTTTNNEGALYSQKVPLLSNFKLSLIQKSRIRKGIRAKLPRILNFGIFLKTANSRIRSFNTKKHVIYGRPLTQRTKMCFRGKYWLSVNKENLLRLTLTTRHKRCCCCCCCTVIRKLGLSVIPLCLGKCCFCRQGKKE
jgi:hypothetical protein